MAEDQFQAEEHGQVTETGAQTGSPQNRTGVAVSATASDLKGTQGCSRESQAVFSNYL